MLVVAVCAKLYTKYYLPSLLFILQKSNAPTRVCINVRYITRCLLLAKSCVLMFTQTTAAETARYITVQHWELHNNSVFRPDLCSSVQREDHPGSYALRALRLLNQFSFKWPPACCCRNNRIRSELIRSSNIQMLSLSQFNKLSSSLPLSLAHNNDDFKPTNTHLLKRERISNSALWSQFNCTYNAHFIIWTLVVSEYLYNILSSPSRKFQVLNGNLISSGWRKKQM